MSTVEQADVLESLALARPVVERISAEVWDLAELSLEEVESAKVHIRELEAAGFTVETGTAGVETAFVAERRFGDGSLVVGSSEYDALRGLGNEAVPRQQPRADGKRAGTAAATTCSARRSRERRSSRVQGPGHASVASGTRLQQPSGEAPIGEAQSLRG